MGYAYESIPVMYVRHLVDISREGLTKLAEEKRIAVHWGDIRTRDPDEYYDYWAAKSGNREDSAKSDIEDINSIDETGAIVVADYSSDFKGRKGIYKSKLFCGVIPSGSFQYREYPKVSGELGLFKTLEFDSETYQEILLTERPDIFSDIPARGTINSCLKTEDRIRTLVDPSRTVERMGPEHLDHNQFEHVCVQYLSLIEYPESGFYTVGPVGGMDGNQKLIDINAGLGETRVVGQVTTAAGHGEVQSKYEDLVEEFDDDVEVFFFGPQEYVDEFEGQTEQVRYIGDQKVFNRLESDPAGKSMLDRILHR